MPDVTTATAAMGLSCVNVRRDKLHDAQWQSGDLVQALAQVLNIMRAPFLGIVRARVMGIVKARAMGQARSAELFVSSLLGAPFVGVLQTAHKRSLGVSKKTT